MKKYTKAPLPFQGQKRYFLRDFAKVVSLYPADTTFVDLFGGSGLLSHTAKYARPTARVIYNDFDNYAARLAAIPETNRLRAEIREILKDCPLEQRIPEEQRLQILETVKREEDAGNFVDYKTLAAKFADDKTAVFICDPPYLSTDCTSYECYWKLKDYLDVMLVLENRHFIYFTSNKSQIVELFEALEKFGLRNPFSGCEKVSRRVSLSHQGCGYEDQMYYTLPNWR